MMKHFLADYWFVGRTLKGLSTDPLYAEAILGHTGIINPRERCFPAEASQAVVPPRLVRP